MATTVRSKLSTILPKLKTRLMAVTGLPTECVVWTYQKIKPPSFQADWYIQLHLGSAMTEQSIVQGAGRIDARVVRRLLVINWMRLELDVDGQADAWLFSSTLGLLDREHMVFDALTTYHPTDATDNWLLTDTLRLGPVGEPNPVPNLEGWGHSEVAIEVPYVLELNQNYQ